MTTAQYISVRETAQLLGISEKKVMDLIEERKLNAYRIANQFLRLKKSEVLGLRNAGSVSSETKSISYTLSERINDAIYFNDYYIVSALIILTLLYFIFFL
jgi:excisionase family DNA binding protein